jgi:methylmalonyl-CoA/ethylmalonyl-CoA epimerase
VPRVLRINHIGLAAQDGGPAAAFWQALGLPLERCETVPLDRVAVSFLPVGESRIEVLEPLGPEGPVQKFLSTRGEGMHHLCLEVDDLAGMLAQLQAAGVELVDQAPRPGAHGTRVAFIHPRATHGVLIELVETGSGHAPD